LAAAAILAPRLPWSANVWQGVSVENARYSSRVADLVKVPAVVRFLSVEPLLGAIPELPLDGVQWVIVGGESGPGHRPVREEWVRDIREQCGRRAGVAFFFGSGVVHVRAAEDGYSMGASRTRCLC